MLRYMTVLVSAVVVGGTSLCSEEMVSDEEIGVIVFFSSGPTESDGLQGVNKALLACRVGSYEPVFYAEVADGLHRQWKRAELAGWQFTVQLSPFFIAKRRLTYGGPALVLLRGRELVDGKVRRAAFVNQQTGQLASVLVMDEADLPDGEKALTDLNLSALRVLDSEMETVRIPGE